MAPQGAGPPRSWPVTPNRPGTAVPSTNSSTGDTWLGRSVWTMLWPLPQRAIHQVLPFVGLPHLRLFSGAARLSDTELPIHKSATEPLRGHCDRRVTRLPGAVASGPPCKPESHHHVSCSYVSKIQLTYETTWRPRGVASRFKMAFAWEASAPKRKCPRALVDMAPPLYSLLRLGSLLGPFREVPVHVCSPVSNRSQTSSCRRGYTAPWQGSSCAGIYTPGNEPHGRDFLNSP